MKNLNKNLHKYTLNKLLPKDIPETAVIYSDYSHKNVHLLPCFIPANDTQFTTYLQCIHRWVLSGKYRFTSLRILNEKSLFPPNFSEKLGF